ncbi:hypothetical protein GCM10027275_14760 [Rhabdobacter roseus]|uniref:VOC family protein n=1 Tax=Rhabdobacter roseus TaxID=1655419 RepID=A0A840TGX3_9BACT|nr:hypothetical protein [Rhabdobacter roseus]MBB5283396.1 hypothetical protein [Rhabdobacter roseus]
MHPKEWMTIPVLPCLSLDETLAFWQTLGYQVTYHQKSPYPYGVVEQGGYALHFRRVKGLNPAQSNSGCLVMVTDVERVHQDFSQRLRAQLGKVSSTGLPRLSRMRPGQSRFTVTDPAGNYVIFINLGEQDTKTYQEADHPNLSPLQKAIAVAVRLRDFKNDDPAAAKTLDVALRRAHDESRVDTAQALLMRAELALQLGDLEREHTCQAELRTLRLNPDEKYLLQHKPDLAPLLAKYLPE